MILRVRIALAPALAAVVAAVVLLLTFATVQLAERTAGREVEAAIRQSLAELAFQTTDKLDQGMYERYREVMLMAQRHEITNGNVPAAVKRGVLDSMQDTYPHYAWIGLTDNDGKVRIATKGLLEGADVSKRPWWAAAYLGEHLHDVHEAVLLAKLLPNPSGEPKRFFDIAFPYRGPDGRPAGVLGTHLSWQWAQQVEQSVLRPLADRNGVETLILSRGGVVLLGPKDLADKTLALPSLDEARRGMNGARLETWPDGRRYLVGYSRSRGHRSYPGLGWTVLVRQPVEEAYRPVEALKRRILGGGLVAALLVPLFVWALARGMSRPLRTITRHADALHAGAIHDLPPLRSRLLEVDILQRALNGLLARVRGNEQGLRELNAHLETRVTERTAELHAAVERTRKGEQRVNAIIDTALDAFVGIDAGGTITDWNPRAEEIFGWTRAEALGRNVTETIIPPRFRAAHEHGMRRFAATGSSGVVNTRIQLSAIRRGGEEFPVEMTIGLIGAGSGQFFGAFIQDISERKRIEQELARERELLEDAARRLEKSERNLRTITDNLPVLIAYVDPDGRYRFANATHAGWHGMPVADIVGKTLADVIDEEARPRYLAMLRENVAGRPVRFETDLRGPDGVRTVQVTGLPDVQDGVFHGVYLLSADITQAKRHEEALSRLARTDTLTGLPNRRSHDERLREAAQRARRTGQALALMFLDVDHFKQINDTLGHAGGDAVLHEFARRVRAAVRVTDTVCRLAGDEFTVILEGLKTADEAALVANKILAAFAAPFDLDDGPRTVSTSIGVAYADSFPVEVAALGAAADQALYAAKAAGRARFALRGMAPAPRAAA